MEISVKQRKTDGVWVAKARFELSVREEGESESAARAALEQKVREILEAELHGNDGSGKEDTTQQEINAKLEELRPYWRDHDWMTLDDVIETNGCRGIEYKYGKEVVWLYVDFQSIAKFNLWHVPEELFPNGKWFIGNCEKKATCAHQESALWRRHKENKAKYLKELEKEKLEAAKKVDPVALAKERAEMYFQLDVERFVEEQLRCLYVYGIYYERAFKEQKIRVDNPVEGLDRKFVSNAVRAAGGEWDRRKYRKALEEVPSVHVEVEWEALLDGESLMNVIVDGVYSVAKSNYNSAGRRCTNALEWAEVVQFTLKDGKLREAVEFLDKMWSELGWGKFLDV